jgi:hypothetical protein
MLAGVFGWEYGCGYGEVEWRGSGRAERRKSDRSSKCDHRKRRPFLR